MEFIVTLSRNGATVQAWGPFPAASAAEAARDGLKAWPTLDGDWTLVPLTRLVEQPGTAPAAAPIVLPMPYVQPPAYPWPNPVWCGPAPHTRQMGIDAAASTTLFAGYGYTPAQAAAMPNWTVNLMTDGVHAWTSDSARVTLGRIDAELREDPDDKDPPAAVAAKL